MYKITRTAIRTDLNTPFWDFTPEQKAEIKAKYEDTGKRISSTVTIDEHVETRESIWTSYEDWEVYSNEYTAIWTARDQYYLENSIVAVRNTEVISN